MKKTYGYFLLRFESYNEKKRDRHDQFQFLLIYSVRKV